MLLYRLFFNFWTLLSSFTLWLIFVLSLLSSPLQAQNAGLHASVDRNTVRMGETVRLTIEAMQQIDGNKINLSGLEKSFKVLGRSSSSSVSIVNGSQTIRTQLLFELEPLREGQAVIPELSIGNLSSKPVQLNILPEDVLTGESSAFFVEVVANPEQTWVEAPITLSIKLFISESVNLMEGSLDEPRIDGAQLQRLGDDLRYTATKNGNRFSIVERRYVLHTSRSGDLRIPKVRFTGEIEDTGQASLNSFFRRGRRVNASSQELVLSIKSPPALYSAEKWLPATEVLLTEAWENNGEGFEVGVPVTRTLKLVARGLRGQQLPEFNLTFPDTVSAYPDKPTIESGLDQSELIGVLEQKIALVPLVAGPLQLPSVAVSWWDIKENIEKTVQLPGRTIEVMENQALSQQVSSNQKPTGMRSLVHEQGQSSRWKYGTIIFAVLWLATLLLAVNGYYRRPHVGKSSDVDTHPVARSKVARKNIKKALLSNNAVAARQAIIAWCNSVCSSGPVISLDGVIEALKAPLLEEPLGRLNDACYGKGIEDFKGPQLWTELDGLLKINKETIPAKPHAQLPELYTQH